MNPKYISGYFLNSLQPLLFAVIVSFIFEVDLSMALIISYSLWAVYLVYRIFVATGETHYAPMLEELSEEKESLLEEYGKLETDYTDFVTWAKAEITLKNEGIASLMENAKRVEAENNTLKKRVETLESGTALQASQLEVNRLTQEVSAKQVQLTTLASASQAKILALEKEVYSLGNQVVTLEKQNTRLLEVERRAERALRDTEIANAQRSFMQALNRGKDETIIASAEKLQALGIDPTTLFTDADKDKARRYEEVMAVLA